MRVTIDATSALLRSAGVKSYTYHWIRHLRRQAGPGEILAFPYLGEFGSLDHEGSVIPFWRTAPRIALLHSVNLIGPPLLDAVLAGSEIFLASNQVRHAPRRARLTATLHDLTCWLMPHFHTNGNLRADQNFAERILRRADGLIAVSENTRQDAIRLLHLPPEKIETIYSGVGGEYFDAPPAPRNRPYVLYVGTIEPRKNLDTLLDAWRQLKPELRREFDLVAAGPLGWSAKATAARIRDEATYLGYVPEAQLPGLVAGATLFVYPSLYEGFGFPVVQAMAARVPVVTSNNSCLPEIAGDGALLVDPNSAAEIAAGLTQLLESESQRGKLAACGRRRAERYRWETCAARSLEFFRRINGLASGCRQP
jgi:glycosyltransferase involved in cell wall biosynthesis